MRVETFASAQDFLGAKRPDAPACLVPDVKMPGPSGLDLQLKLRDTGMRIPIIFIAGHGDIPMSVCAMKEGAPRKRQELSEIRGRFQSLTSREREVLGLVSRHLPLLGVLLVLIVAGKFLVWTTVVWMFRYPFTTAVAVASGLTQIGELSFVVVDTA